MGTLKIKDLSYWYPKAKKPALDDINFEIPQGQFIAILGPSAAGKTTLALALSGAVRHLFGGRVQGTLAFDGEDLNRSSLPDIATKFGVVFEDPETMFCNLRVREEIAFGLENLCVEPSRMVELVHRALDVVGLDGFEDRFIHELSGGETQRLAIACALALDPPFLVFDEPTSSVDPAGIETLLRLFYELRANGKTIIVTSKEWDQCATDADTVVVLDHGKLVCQGSPRDIARTSASLLREIGIVLPQVAEIALDLKEKGVSFASIPLTVSEATELLPLVQSNSTQESEDTRLDGADPTLKVNAVSFVYANGVRAVDNVEMYVEAGCTCALVGNNGAGKTTLAKLIAGLLRPTSGSIEVCGQKAKSRHLLRTNIAYAFQNPVHQILTESVYDEIALGMRLHKETEPSVEREVNSLLERFDLFRVRDAHPLTLIPSEQRLVGLASLLILKPRVLIVDEPTHGQDRFATETLRSVFGELKSDGVTVILISHDMRFVEECADVTYVMSAGEMVFAGSPRELMQRPDIMRRAALRPTQLSMLTQMAQSGKELDVVRPTDKPHSTSPTRRTMPQDQRRSRGILRKADALSIVACVAGCSIVLFFMRNPVSGALMTAGLALLLLMGRDVPLSRFLKSLPLVLMVPTCLLFFHAVSHSGNVVLELGPLTVTREGLMQGWLFFFRVSFVVLASFAVTWVVDIREFMVGLVRIGLPYRFAFATYLAMRYIPIMRRERDIVRDAMLVRRQALRLGPKWLIRLWVRYIFLLVVTGLRKADQTAAAMELRGFGVKRCRTFITPFSFTLQGFTLIFVTAVAIGVLFWQIE